VACLSGTPSEGICRIHGIPIAPSRLRSRHKFTDCARCRAKHSSKLRNDSERHYRDGMKRRTQLRGRLRGLLLFERITGLKIYQEQP
jgi:hypothetical protein